MAQDMAYQPLVLVDTAQLARPDWLAYRRKGLGGSDAAAVLGISPFRTGRDLYFDKLGIITADDQDNWVALEVGNLLEPLVARIFAKKTGLRIYQRKCMFQHPYYPWMLADLDYLVELPDGTTAILEIKTTNYNAKEKWWYNGNEIVPVYYESQGRHYMAVMNLDRVYYCCLYGNNEDETIIRHIDRDMDYEMELIALEQDFWQNHVLAKSPPPYLEDDGDLILESLRRALGPADTDAPSIVFSATQSARVNSGISLLSSSNNTVTGNTCNSNNAGISLNSSSNNTVTGNTCDNNEYGIYLSSSSSNNTITGNTCIRGTGISSDYTSEQHTLRLSGTSNNYNLIACNNIMGKNYTSEGGTGNTFVNNKYN